VALNLATLSKVCTSWGSFAWEKSSGNFRPYLEGASDGLDFDVICGLYEYATSLISLVSPSPETFTVLAGDNEGGDTRNVTDDVDVDGDVVLALKNEIISFRCVFDVNRGCSVLGTVLDSSEIAMGDFHSEVFASVRGVFVAGYESLSHVSFAVNTGVAVQNVELIEDTGGVNDPVAVRTDEGVAGTLHVLVQLHLRVEDGYATKLGRNGVVES
jgi:hypothetical protein